MAGDEDMEDDDDDDVDFNPYLQCSPSRDVESGENLQPARESPSADWESAESLKRAGESPSADGESGGSLKHAGDLEGADGEVFGEEEANGFLATEYVQMLGESEHSIGEYDGEDRFFELGSDDYEEEEFEEMDQEEMVHDDGDRGALEIDQESTKDALNGTESEHFGGCLNLVDDGLSTWEDQDLGHQNLDCLKNPMQVKDGTIWSTRTEDGTQESPDGNCTNPLFGSDRQESAGSLSCHMSEGKGEDVLDAISKRTRANYSLADMSLDQLEMFLQESDEDENFQGVDDEEEYRKFLVAVQEHEDVMTEQPEEGTRKEDEDDEEDVDFEVEIEEALESDDTSESLRTGKRRRPETREKRRQRAHLQAKGSLLGQSIVPLRHLLPHAGNLVDDVAMIEKRKTTTESVNIVWPHDGKTKAPVNGFTAHQIGQLYCLIHEHVQLLVQVYSLSVLEPGRQQIATDTRQMLMELVEKRELLLSWKKTAFPEFCFRPPYTHPSLVESEDNQLTNVFTFAPDTGQSTQAPSNAYPGYCFPQGSVSNLSSSSTSGAHNFCQNTPVSPSVATVQESAPYYAFSEHFPKRTPGTSHHWQESVRPFATCIPGLDAMQIPQSAACGMTHTSTRTPSAVTAKCARSSAAYLAEFPVQAVYNNCEDPSSLTSVQRKSFPQSAMSCSAASLSTESASRLLRENVKIEWAPITSGPVRSLLDVAPLALVRVFLMDISQVVQEYRQRHLDNGVDHKCEREPLFVTSAVEEHDQVMGRNLNEGTQSQLVGGGDILPACVPRPQIKKTMAAALVESIKKQSLALVPKDAAIAVQRFLLYFNKAFFPHKPPPAATASRLLFTDAEDELLAMGLMMYNTDWKAIQQRFLPSKSMHQIFVRQKNRSSARAPENSIKAVRRMKSSPLTSSEKTSIQEALGMFKYDWNKVWQYCVPHRDPAILPRQWRIAVGTQKSYKTSETSKERRRLYEADRRKRIATNRVGEKTAIVEEDAHTGSTGTSVEGVNGKSTNKNADDAENSYIRDAFLDNWCPRSTPPIGASGPRVGRQRKTVSSSSKKRRANTESHLSDLSTWLGSQSVKAICQKRKQTVKLAPGLPSVKLPPRVHVLSQSHVQTEQSFSLATRLPPVTSQWAQIAGQHLEKLESSLPSNHANMFMQQLGVHKGACTALKSTHASNHFVYGRGGQTIVPTKKVLRATREPDEPTVRATELVDRKSRSGQLSPRTKMKITHGPLMLPSDDSTLATDLSSQSLTPFLQHCSSAYNPPFHVDTTVGGLPVIERRDMFPAQSIKEDGVALPTDQFGFDGLDQMHMSVTSVAHLASTKSAHCHAARLCAVKSSALHPGSESQICNLQSPIQASASISTCETASAPLCPLDYQPMMKGVSAVEVSTSRSKLPMDLMHADGGVRNARDLTGQGSSMASRGRAKVNKKETRNSKQRILRSSSKLRVPQRRKPNLVVKGGIQNIHTSSQRCRGKSVRKRHGGKCQKVEGFVAPGSRELDDEQHVIVMEQEELSDSEEEADAGLQFEHEEMCDSDKDAEVELRNGKQSRTHKSR